MYYFFRDNDGVDPLDILIMKLIDRDGDLIRVCGCQFTFTVGRLKLKKRKYNSYPIPNLKGDYFSEDFSALHFNDFNIENLSLLGLGNFHLEQLDISVFDPTPETVFEALN